VILRAAASPLEAAFSCVFLRPYATSSNLLKGLASLRCWGFCATRGALEPLAAVTIRPASAASHAAPRIRRSGMEEVEAALDSLKYRHLEALQRGRADIAEAERAAIWHSWLSSWPKSLKWTGNA